MIYSTTLPAQSPGAADQIVLIGAYSPAFYSGDTVTDVEIAAPAGYSTVNGQVANNVTINVRQLRGGVVVTTFASLTITAGIAVSAENPVSVPITAQPILLEGDAIDVQMHQNGTGQALGAGLVLSVYIS